ncbi:related to VMA21 - ATPase assembly integral membrane protein [Ustilago trichophora]|uniref:Related to VMA21 - ATPase assembly integral membrane protein n=1 Tax=Ustilago trichophora TaxID=86804 RepID=A0A5C3E5Y8_9BASI|nr:related to VMA21 - ATPase assembly integral membrane protein [Ustilago trichophora]
MSSLDVTPSRVAPRGKDPAQGVYYKLALFSVALFAAPLFAYYFAKDRYFAGNATYAGGLAALVVNLVLGAYVVVAFLEDDSDVVAAAKQSKGQKTKEEGKKDK